MKRKMIDDQERLVCENLEYAKKLAWTLGGFILKDRHEKSITMDDLEQEAVIGLIEAAKRYQVLEAAVAGASFQTWSFFWIRKYVLRAIRKYGTPLSVPDNFKERVKLLHLDVMMEDVASAYASCDDDGSPADRIFYQVSMNEEREQETNKQRKELLVSAMSELNTKEQAVLTCLYGLDGKELSNAETAESLNIVPGRVSQLSERALRKLESLFVA